MKWPFHSHPKLEERVAELESQIVGMTELLASMHIDLYTALLEKDEQSGT